MDFREEYERISAQMESLRQERSALLERVIRDHCPYKAGDTVTVNGFRHEGKQMLIENIYVREDSRHKGSAEGLVFVFRGPVLKADKTPGQHRSESVLPIPDIQPDDGLDEVGKHKPSPAPALG